MPAVNAKVSSSWHPCLRLWGKGALYSAAKPQDVRRQLLLLLCCCAAAALLLLCCSSAAALLLQCCSIAAAAPLLLHWCTGRAPSTGAWSILKAPALTFQASSLLPCASLLPSRAPLFLDEKMWARKWRILSLLIAFPKSLVYSLLTPSPISTCSFLYYISLYLVNCVRILHRVLGSYSILRGHWFTSWFSETRLTGPPV